MYNSLSVGVHVEYLVHDDYACLKIWSPLEGHELDEKSAEITLDVEGQVPTVESSKLISKSLNFSALPKYMEFPKLNKGVYHNRLPAGSIFGEEKLGEDFLPNIPASIRDSVTEQLTGQWFRNCAYSWIDPSDPSIRNGEHSDVACWVIGVMSSSCPRTSPAYNALTHTFNSKAHPLRSVRQYGAPASLFVYQPFQSDKFTDCSVTLKYNKGFGFSTNILTDWEAPADYNYLGQLGDAMPHFTVTSGGGDIAADESDTVEFKMTEKDGTLIEKDTTVYLESTGGYLPKTRVAVTDGLGSFKVSALGLATDDTFKVKIGFRNFTGVEDVQYTVT